MQLESYEGMNNYLKVEKMIKGIVLTIMGILVFWGLMTTTIVFSYTLADIIVKAVKKVTRRFANGHR